MCFLIALLWLLLSVRYRRLSLPQIANPAIPRSAMMGVAKTAVFHAAGKIVIQWSLPWIACTVSGISEREQAEIFVLNLIASDHRFL